MTDRLSFDDRLLNRYTVEDLEKSHPPLFSALQAWFRAFGDFDDTALAKLIAARGRTEVEKWKDKGHAALAAIPGIVQTLDTVIRELERVLVPGAYPERDQLEQLLAAARVNRAALVDHAPALVAKALGSVGAYDETKSEAAAAVARTAKQLEEIRDRSADPSRSYRELQPLVEELKQTWAALDHALEHLSRQDQRAGARAPGCAHARGRRRTLPQLVRPQDARPRLGRLACSGDFRPRRVGARALRRGARPR